MSRPLISIIIPVLNSREVIERALETIAKQTFSEIEVIISDGGSTDDTAGFALSYLANASIKATAIIQPGSSIYGSLNLAGRIAQGEWQYVLGSDDRLYNNDTLADIGNSLRLTKADVCHGNAWNANANQLICSGAYTLNRFIAQNICHQAIFYRSSTIRRLGIEYNERYRLLADWDYNLKLLSRCRFHCLPTTVAIFSGTGKSSCEEDYEFRMDLEANIIRYFGLRMCYLMHPDCLEIVTSRHPRRGNRILLAANRLFYSKNRLAKLKLFTSSP
jgi:glycosyltransferase involved in cell wall biosynthesis